MRTEFKVAIVVGLVVIAGGVIYFVNRGGGNQRADVLPMNAPAQQAAGAKKTIGPNAPAVAQRPSATPVTPPGGYPSRSPNSPTVAGPNTPLRPTPGQQATDPNALKVAPAQPPSVAPLPGTTAGDPNAHRPAPTVATPPLTRETSLAGDNRANLPPLVGGAGKETPSGASPNAPAGDITGSGVAPPLRSDATSPAVPPLEVPRPAATGPNAPRPASPGPNAPAIGPSGGISTNVPPAGGARYTVKEGEYLWTIAEDYYGDGHQWVKIRAANPGIDPDHINAGQVIILPPKEPNTPRASQSPPRDPNARPSGTALRPTDPNSPAQPRPGTPGTAAPPGPGPTTRPATNGTTAAGRPQATRTYTAAEKDTLISIARKQLGDPSAWRRILELNRDKLTRPEDLRPGMVLRLPERANNTTPPTRPAQGKANERK